MSQIDNSNAENTVESKSKLGILAILIMVITVLAIGRVSIFVCEKVVSSLNKNTDLASNMVTKAGDFEVKEPEILENAAVSYTEPKLKNEDQLNAFLNKYSGVWYMKKEFNEEEEWKYHDLGKKIGIFVFNRLNDYSTRTVIGTKTHTKTLYIGGEAVASSSYDETIYGADERHDGSDIKYDEDLIILTKDYVDFSDIGGPMFSMEDFRYENIRGYDYIISDLYGFGLCFDGSYLEYVEPDSIGYYQGYFAFGNSTWASVINQDWNDDWN